MLTLRVLQLGALACLAIGLLSGCDTAAPEPTDAELPDASAKDAGGAVAVDASMADDAGGVFDRKDAEVDAQGDGAPADDGAVPGCQCVHGACVDDGCACEPTWSGALCDEPEFVGDGRDGALLIAKPTNLSTANHAGRSCADGGDAVTYSVMQLLSATQARVVPTPAAGCLSVGDEVLLANLQGTSSSTANLGRAEFFEIASIAGDVVTFTAPKLGFYGQGATDDVNLGTDRGKQRVILQRVPHYTNVTLTSGQVLTANAWDGVRGGVLAFRARGRVIAAGRIDMVARGYVGADQTSVVNTTGRQGEGGKGLGVSATGPNAGGGGGGAGDTLCDSIGFSGGGGGHVGVGQAGSRSCTGQGGQAYAQKGRYTLGAGGGAGGSDNSLSDNPPGGAAGAGGGVILVFARELHVFGEIDASGASGQGDANDCVSGSTTECWDYSGAGGGGAGGTVYLESDVLALGTAQVRALGGAGGNGSDDRAGNAGAGGTGQVMVRGWSSLSGSSDPPAQ